MEFLGEFFDPFLGEPLDDPFGDLFGEAGPRAARLPCFQGLGLASAAVIEPGSAGRASEQPVGRLPGFRKVALSSS